MPAHHARAARDVGRLAERRSAQVRMLARGAPVRRVADARAGHAGAVPGAPAFAERDIAGGAAPSGGARADDFGGLGMF